MNQALLKSRIDSIASDTALCPAGSARSRPVRLPSSVGAGLGNGTGTSVPGTCMNGLAAN